jgi:hypothetical protein
MTDTQPTPADLVITNAVVLVHDQAGESTSPRTRPSLCATG